MSPAQTTRQMKLSFKQILKNHDEAVKAGCTCPTPTKSKESGMVFRPLSIECPKHGELAH